MGQENRSSLSKPWYRTWWGILIIVVTFPVSLPLWALYYIWFKAKWNTLVKLIPTIFIVPFLIAVLTGIFSGNSSSTQTTKQSGAVNAIQQAPAAKPVQNVTSTQPVATKPATTLDQLWSALDTSVGTRDGFNISFDQKTKTAELAYTITQAWDESAMVRSGYAAMVKYGQAAFTVVGVDALTIHAKATFVDTYGKSSVGDALIMTMPKSEFVKYDWSAFSYLPVETQMKQSCTQYWISPAILKNVDPSKLYLSEQIK